MIKGVHNHTKYLVSENHTQVTGMPKMDMHAAAVSVGLYYKRRNLVAR